VNDAGRPANRRWLPGRLACAALLLLVGGGSAGGAAGAKHANPKRAERVTMIPARPLLNLRIDIDSCQFDLFVNGALVMRNMEGTPIHEEQPINPFVRSGSNEIEVLMYVDSDAPDACEAKVSLVIKDADHDQAAGATALVLGHSAKAGAADPTAGSTPAGVFDSRRGFEKPADKGDVKVGPARLRHLPTHRDPLDMLGRSFDMSLPFPEWAFFKGDKMKQGWEYETKDALKAGYAQVLPAYVQLAALLEKRDVTGFVDACEERSHEIDLAFYKSAGETRRRLAEQLKTAFADPTLKLEATTPPPGKYWSYSVGSKGNLIALTQGSRGSSVIGFESTDGNLYRLGFPVTFRKQGDRFVVTR
jgi:hypothetical protein